MCTAVHDMSFTRWLQYANRPDHISIRLGVCVKLSWPCTRWQTESSNVHDRVWEATIIPGQL